MRHLAQASDAQLRIGESILIIVVMDSGLALRAPRNDESNLGRNQILDSDAVAIPDDLGDPLPVAMAVVALVAENADRAGFFHQRRQLVELLPGLCGLQMRRINFVQQYKFAATRRLAAAL